MSKMGQLNGKAAVLTLHHNVTEVYPAGMAPKPLAVYSI